MNNGPAAAFDIVDQNVKTAEMIDDPLNQAGCFFNFKQIGFKDKMGAAGIGEILFQPLEFFFPVKIIQGYLYPLLRQGQPDLFADTLNCA